MKGRKKILDWEHYREKKAYVRGTGQPMTIGKHVCEELQVTRRKQKRKKEMCEEKCELSDSTDD